MIEGRIEFEELAGSGASALAGASPEETLIWALSAVPPPRRALCTSFQKEGMAILDMAARLDRELHVFTIDTGRLPEETLAFIDLVRSHYGHPIEVISPDAGAVSSLVSAHGPNLFYRAPELRLACCEIRKVEPLRRRLASLDLWITGVRNGQTEARQGVATVEFDTRNGGLIKVNPLAKWSESQVDQYIARHHVPRHPLYAAGYTSIGCAPCTRAVSPGEDPRAGRWWWEGGFKECGLHFDPRTGARA